MVMETELQVTSHPIAGRPANMPWVTSYLVVQDVLAPLDFYEAAFGLQRREVQVNPDGSVTHAAAVWQQGLVMVGLEGAYGGTTMAPRTTGSACPVSIYIYCADVDALAGQAREAGAEVKFGPTIPFR